MWKLGKGDSLQTFYYMALSIESSSELSKFTKINKWYFDKMSDEIKQQLRDNYTRMKLEEMEEIGEKDIG